MAVNDNRNGQVGGKVNITAKDFAAKYKSKRK